MYAHTSCIRCRCSGRVSGDREARAHKSRSQVGFPIIITFLLIFHQPCFVPVYLLYDNISNSNKMILRRRRHYQWTVQVSAVAGSSRHPLNRNIRLNLHYILCIARSPRALPVAKKKSSKVTTIHSYIIAFRVPFRTTTGYDLCESVQS